MPRLRRSIQRMNQLSDQDDSLPIDEDDQQELLDLLKVDNLHTNKLFINIFTVIYLLPIPLFIHVKYFRVNATVSFLSIVSLILSLVKIRYLHVVDFQNYESVIVKKLSLLYEPLVFNMFNFVISIVVVYLRYDKGYDLNLVYLLPMLACLSSMLLMYWILELDNDIVSLSKLKYKYKSA